MRLKNGYFVWNTIECDEDGMPVRLFGHAHPAYPLLDQIAYELDYLNLFFRTHGVNMSVLNDRVGFDLEHLIMDLPSVNLHDISRHIEALRAQEKLILNSGIPIKPVEFKNGWEDVEHPNDYIHHMRGDCDNCFYCQNEDKFP